MPPVERRVFSKARHRRLRADRGVFGPADRAQNDRRHGYRRSACAAARCAHRFPLGGGTGTARAAMPRSVPVAAVVTRPLVEQPGAEAATGRSPSDRRHRQLVPRPQPTAPSERPQTPSGGASRSKPLPWDRRRKKLWYSGTFSSFARLYDDIGHHWARMTTEFGCDFRSVRPGDCLPLERRK